MCAFGIGHGHDTAAGEPAHRSHRSPAPVGWLVDESLIEYAAGDYDKALAESFVDSFKTDLIADLVWRSRSQRELAVAE